MNLREDQTTGFSNTGVQGHPVTKVYDGDKLLGTLRNDGFQAHDGDFVNNWVAFAGGAAVAMPAGFPTTRETAKQELIRYAARAIISWQLAGSN
jgi:hypothetical protein